MSCLGEDDIVFCDFDGTISQTDVLGEVFSEFGGAIVQQLEEDFRANKIDDRETLTRKWSHIELDYQQFRNYILNNVSLDPDFKIFAQKLIKRGIELVILSGGFLNYIELLLDHNNINFDVPIYGNRLEFEGKKVIPHFLHDIESCHQSFGVCGSCKWKVMEDWDLEDRPGKVVYIGDGLTDRCPAEKTDYLLAKKNKSLAEYCQKREINFTEFENFNEVINILLHK